jgi:hypothetical protein
MANRRLFFWKENSIWREEKYMSNKKPVKSVESVESGESKMSFGRIFPIGIVVLLAVGVFGAIGSNLNLFGGSSNAIPTTQNSVTPNSATQHSSSAKTVSPTNATVTTATPVLSKEIIYAGSRMVAVEDANANAAPPADLAVWRPSSGVWYVLGGPNSAQTFFQWGVNGDKTAQGDYDGDGKTDFCVFRPASSSNPNSVFWITKSSENNSYSER